MPSWGIWRPALLCKTVEDGLALPGHLLERIIHCHDNDRRNDRRADETGRKRHHLPVKTSSLRRPAGCCLPAGLAVNSGKQRMLAKFQGSTCTICRKAAIAFGYYFRQNCFPFPRRHVCFCFSRCPAERLICPSKTREIKEKNKRFHRLKFFSFSFCRYSCCFPKSLPSLPGRAGQGIDGLVSSRKSKSSPGTFPNYCK